MRRRLDEYRTNVQRCFKLVCVTRFKDQLLRHVLQEMGIAEEWLHEEPWQEIHGQLVVRGSQESFPFHLFTFPMTKWEALFDHRIVSDWNFNFDVLQNSLRPNLILVPQDALTCDSIYPKKTLFIGSPISNYIPRDSHDEIKQYFPNAEFVYIDGAGHWIQADKPKEFISVVLKFLAS